MTEVPTVATAKLKLATGMFTIENAFTVWIIRKTTHTDTLSKRLRQKRLLTEPLQFTLLLSQNAELPIVNVESESAHTARLTVILKDKLVTFVVSPSPLLKPPD